MTDLAGTLVSIGVAPLLGFLAQLRKTGALSISDGPLSGSIFLEAGRVVGANFESEHGVAAFEAIVLVLGAGEFAFDADVAERDFNFMVDPDGLDQLLARLSEERARFAHVLPSLAVVPVARLAGAEDDQLSVDRTTLRLLLEVDSRRSVLDLGRKHGLVAAARGISRLVELGLVTVEPLSTGHAASSAASSPRPPSAAARLWPSREGGTLGENGGARSSEDQRPPRWADGRTPDHE